MSEAKADANNELLDSLLGDFLDESNQLLSQLNANLLQLDEWVQTVDDVQPQRCDEGLLNEMFRAAHSLKGLSAMLGLTNINHLTHKIENVFDAARHDQLSITRDVTEMMFMGLDHLTAMVGLLKEPDGDPVDCQGVLENIQRMLQSAGAEKKQSTQADAERALKAPCHETTTSPTPPQASAANAPPPENLLPSPPDFLAEIKDETEIAENYLAIFVDEADAALDVLTSGLLSVENAARQSGETVNETELRNLLGTAHKIKGSSASIGLNRAAKLAHLMEDLLEKAVANEIRISPPVADVLLRTTDGLRQYAADLRTGTRAFDSFTSLAHDLLFAHSLHQSSQVPGPVPLAANSATSAAEAKETAAGTSSQPSAQGQAPTGRTTYRGEITFQTNLSMAGLKAQLVLEKLRKLGEVSDCQPPAEQLDAIDRLDCFRFQLTTDQPTGAIAGQLRIGGVQQIKVEPLPAEATDTAPRVAAPAGSPSDKTPQSVKPSPRPAAPSQRPVETVRVDTDRLDQLMDLAGQLVINKAQFSQIGLRLKSVSECSHSVRALDKLSGELERLGAVDSLRLDGKHLAAELESIRGQIRRIRSDLEPVRHEVQTLSRVRESVRELFEAIHQLDRVSDGMQKSVMDIRMVPIGPLFARFQRVVRDIARASDKDIRLVIAGEKTELDKRMIDELGDPLVHLVRNSADHGVEPPQVRLAAGKPRQGTVSLDAFHRGNSIVIEVRDDGKGLDADRILRKAMDKGLVSEADAQRMTPAQIYQLIWKPGLSTAEKVTDVSGRGMGMDIVKTKIDELSGVVDISSEPGKGTTITIKLPLTLAILPSLMVDIAGDVFAMPMENVKEIVSVAHDQVRMVAGRPMAMVRGRPVSLVRLGDTLTFHSACADEAGAAADATLVIVNDTDRELGLAVDRVIGEEDVVIKSIADNYQNIRGIAGASILGDGRVALILDIPAVINMLSKKVETVNP